MIAVMFQILRRSSNLFALRTNYNRSLRTNEMEEGGEDPYEFNEDTTPKESFQVKIVILGVLD